MGQWAGGCFGFEFHSWPHLNDAEENGEGDGSKGQTHAIGDGFCCGLKSRRPRFSPEAQVLA